jgi:hypothetical protein
MKKYLYITLSIILSFIVLGTCFSAESTIYDFAVNPTIDYGQFETIPIVKQEKDISNSFINYDAPTVFKALEVLNYDVMATKQKVPLSELPGNTKIGIIKEQKTNSGCANGSCSSKPTSKTYQNNSRRFRLFRR